jgi:bifunctional non-homologous end joining protein LigD
MLATPGDITALNAAEWAFEPKVDGFRLIVEIAAGALTLRSRTGLVVTDNYPRLAELAAELAEHSVVLDGEVVVYDDRGWTSFRLLQTEGRRAQFLAFDVLYLDGVSLLRKRYADRRRVLAALAAHAHTLTVLPQLLGSGTEALAHSREQHLEGVVAKRLDSSYLPGKRGKAWVKQKNWRTQSVVVGGWRPGAGHRVGGVGSLLVGIEEHGGLSYVGRVGTGFSDALLRQLAARLPALARQSSPFANELEPDERRDARWVEPVLRAEVRYLEWTDQARLRHPALVALHD